MKEINLRDFYPEIYKHDNYIIVPDDVLTTLIEAKRKEEAFRIRTYRYKAYFSLDYGDNIEGDALKLGPSPYDLYEQKLLEEQLQAAFASLSYKQAKRVYEHFFLGMSKAAIALIEGVNESNVRKSIKRALRKMEVILKKVL